MGGIVFGTYYICLHLHGTCHRHALIQGAFQTADVDASGDLNKADFRTFIVAIANIRHAEADRAVRFDAIGFGAAFRDADKNRNGNVTLRELEAIR